MPYLDRYRSGYLHLYFEDYLNSGSANFNPYSAVSQAKAKIKSQAKARMNIRIKSSAAKLATVEELYNLQESEFAGLGENVSSKMEEANTLMSDFDAAIAELKKLIKDKSQSVDVASSLADNITNSLKRMLEMGRSAGGLSEAAVQEIETTLGRFDTEVKQHLKYGYYRQNKYNKKLIDSIGDVQSNASGYMFELANVYALVGAGAAGFNTIVNIGGKINGKDMKLTLDPKLQSIQKKLNEALAQNNGQQSKADNVLVFNMSEGNGSVSMTTSYVGLQNKNVADLSRVKVASYTLGQLGIGNYYNINFLTNVAGGLAGNQFRLAKKTVEATPRTHNTANITQTSVDELWANIKDSVKILGVADAVAGEMRANVTNQVDYYVIRHKGSGEIRVIPVYEILQNILDKALTGQDTDRINFVGGKNASREQYWSINYQNYVPDASANSRAEAAVMRSNSAYTKVLKAIMDTKIQIAVDFRTWF